MSEYIKIGLKATWLILLAYWFISGIGNKQVKSQEPSLQRFILYWLPLIIAMLLLGPGKWFGDSFLRENFVEHTDLVGVIGLTISILGAFIACWSRYLLGKNWSVSVQKKENHELINSGAYAFVRHPIYTGLLLLFLGNTLIVGDYRGLIAFAIVFLSFWFKLQKEEKWLTEVFGNEYVLYKQRTKAIIPWVL